MDIAAVLAFGGPLIEEAIAMIKQYAAAKAEDQAVILAARDAAIAQMRIAAQAEVAAHGALTEETQRELAAALAPTEKAPVVAPADPVVDPVAVEPDEGPC